MDLKQLEDIANRKTTCHPFGETVSISRVEREELVALAKNGLRYQWLRTAFFQQWLEIGDAEIGMRVYGACPHPSEIDAAIDAAMAAEIGKNMENV